MSVDTLLRDRLETIRAEIAAAAGRAGRDPSDVRLVAASKFQDVELMQQAVSLGVTDFGENYLGEMRSKREQIEGATWHFIGTLQSNTANRAADVSDWVHGYTPGRAALRLAKHAAQAGQTIPVLIQVDFTGSRSGVPPEELEGFADQVADLQGVDLRGLMTLPPMGERPDDARPYFVLLRDLGRKVRSNHPEAVELSMGMSLDYGVAVEEGATMVRVGTALFGERRPDRVP